METNSELRTKDSTKILKLFWIGNRSLDGCNPDAREARCAVQEQSGLEYICMNFWRIPCVPWPRLLDDEVSMADGCVGFIRRS